MRFLLLILFTVLLAQTQLAVANCGGTQPVNVHYGDSEIRVTPVKVRVKRGSRIRFELKPKGSHHRDTVVTIKAKDPDTGAWIDISGNARDNVDRLDVCVPVDQAKGVYEYWVEVDGVGKLDPRADVI